MPAVNAIALSLAQFSRTFHLFSRLETSAERGQSMAGPTVQTALNAGLFAILLLLMSPCHALGQSLDPDLSRTLDAVELNVLGKKQPDLPIPQRLDQLEKTLTIPHNAPSPESTPKPQYRMSQVLSAQQTAINQRNQQLAIAAYNHGVDATNQGRPEVAITDYQRAIQLNPGFVQAYNNLASLQEKKRQYTEAITTYESALQIAPEEPLLHLNLAIILEKQGRVPEAYAHYRQYVQNSPNPKPQIVELVKNFDARRNRGKLEPDYSNLATQESRGERLTWPPELLPVPVCIQLADPGQAAFIDNIYHDLGVWTQVTRQRIRFQEVGYPDKARIVITLKPGPLMDPDHSIGHASFNSQILGTEYPVHNLKVHITVNTGDARNADLPLALRKEQVEKLVLHELGHAIGIWGHSKDPDDIMYTHPIVSRLSQRDINTIRKLYGFSGG